ncbi:MAG: MarR family transcriptional regulator [Anaerolineae bacterium]|nr:MarR family transcriptional regulator [Anaerolineae bacterium]
MPRFPRPRRPHWTPFSPKSASGRSEDAAAEQSEHSLFTDIMRSRQAELLKQMKPEDACSMDAFRNLMKVSGMITAGADKNLDRYGLSMSKLRLLFWLQLRQEEGMLPSELSKLHGVMPNTISSLIVSMARTGWIEIARHPHDRRKRVIRITRKGSNLLEEIGPSHQNFLNRLFSNFSEEEKQTLSEMLSKLTDNVQRLLVDDSTERT